MPITWGNVILCFSVHRRIMFMIVFYFHSINTYQRHHMQDVVLCFCLRDTLPGEMLLACKIQCSKSVFTVRNCTFKKLGLELHRVHIFHLGSCWQLIQNIYNIIIIGQINMMNQHIRSIWLINTIWTPVAVVNASSYLKLVKCLVLLMKMSTTAYDWPGSYLWLVLISNVLH